jgi:hypothetical protein
VFCPVDKLWMSSPASASLSTAPRKYRQRHDCAGSAVSGPFVYPEAVAADAGGIPDVGRSHDERSLSGCPAAIDQQDGPRELARLQAAGTHPYPRIKRRLLRFFRWVFGHRVEGLRQNLLQHDGSSVLHARHNVTVCVHRLGDCGVAKKLLDYLGIDPLREQEC